MFYTKKSFKAIVLFLAVLICAFVFVPFGAYAETGEGLYLGGFPAGFVLSTTKVEVVGICEVLTDKGTCSPARDAGIQAGDQIVNINGEGVNKSSDINEIIAREYKKYEVEILRGSERMTLPVTPVKDLASGGKRIGVLVKDSINGVGTVTYVDKTNNKFASLGHPITDGGNQVIKINGGTVYNSLIYDVKKGVRGTPGELRGAFESSVIGQAELNCSCGVYGKLAENFNCSKLVKISKASIDEVSIGTAYIYSTVYGKDAEMYKISIVKVDKNNKDNRNFVIKVEDKRLIEKTGGIVQGMSGSPIVQDGKLIGAVTHVFINDPTRGYGIGIDKMMSSY
ncbi:MAG: PDZ domain-containing protein [Clostridia bacterium]|nr:PDZ domain-containing protein [Clostridia bacterium]